MGQGSEGKEEGEMGGVRVVGKGKGSEGGRYGGRETRGRKGEGGRMAARMKGKGGRREGREAGTVVGGGKTGGGGQFSE